MPNKKSKETIKPADALAEISELGKKLKKIRKQIEADPNYKPLSIEEVRQEVRRRRNGDWEDED